MHKNTRRRRARRSIAASVLLLVLAGLLAALVVPAIGAEDRKLLPDLVAAAPDKVDPRPVVYSSVNTPGVNEGAPGDRLLLRFESYIENLGDGPVEFLGTDPDTSGADPIMTKVVQRFSHDTTGDGLPDVQPVPDDVNVPLAQMKFERSDGHSHWHLQNAARYSLVRASGTFEDEVGIANKVGFCLLDINGASVKNPLFPTPTFFHDATTHPTYPCLNYNDDPQAGEIVDMGISPGWRDVYERYLALQWVDVSDVQPGVYRLRSEVDTQHLVTESHEDNNEPALAAQNSVVPGYIAKNTGNISVPGGALSSIPLTTTSVSPTLGAQYRVTQLPDNGVLYKSDGTTQIAAGEWFTGNPRFKPDPGFNGPDAFTFEAREQLSSFPLHPTSAVADLTVGSGLGLTKVTIAGHRAGGMYTGTSVDLSAVVNPGPSDNVAWTASAGKITPTGAGTAHYTAPASVPAGKTVTVTATAQDGVSSKVTFPVLARPKQEPAPDVPTPPVTPPTNPGAPVKPLSKPVVARHGRQLIVKFMPGKSGRLSVNVTRKGHRVSSCNAKVIKGRAITCRFVLKKSKVRKLKGNLSVYAKLTSGRKTLAVRRTTVSLAVTASSTRIGPLCILTPIKR